MTRAAIHTALFQTLAVVHSPSPLTLLLHSLTETLSVRLFSSSPPLLPQTPTLDPSPPPPSVASVLRHWGCSDTEVSKILHRRPLVAKTDPKSLHSKFQILLTLGFQGPDLVRFVTCLPRFLARTDDSLAADIGLRLGFLRSLFGSEALVFRIVLRNPSLLNYDIDRMKKCVALYESVGVTRQELATALKCRPTILSRSSLEAEKLDLIRRSGILPGAKLYKYVVSIVAASRLETIREKVTNFERFGLSGDEVWELLGRSPNIMTFSNEKMQRHMAFIMGTMDLPANIVIQFPVLLQINMDKVLKPRFLLMCKLEEMGLYPKKKSPRFVIQGVVRMAEARFINVFINCHEKCVVEDLLEFYNGMKGARRLAESAWLSTRKGFPF